MVCGNASGLLDLTNFTVIDHIGKLPVETLEMEVHNRLFCDGVFLYSILGKHESNVIFRQENKHQKVIAETDCLIVTFEDEQQQVRKFLQEHKLKLKNDLIDLIHTVIFKRKIDKGDIIKHIKLFQKQKYISHS